MNGKTLGELAQDPEARGVYLESLQRGTELMPREAWTVAASAATSCSVVGAPDDVERAGRHIGFVERDLSKTDLTFLAGGICAGMLLGLLKLNVGGIVLGLGTAGSILVVGLVAGWARSRYPVFGAIPGAGAAAADGHRPDRVHRGGRDARRPACRRGLSRRAAAATSPASSSPA